MIHESDEQQLQQQLQQQPPIFQFARQFSIEESFFTAKIVADRYEKLNPIGYSLFSKVYLVHDHRSQMK